MNGTLELHLELEDALARWMRRDAALVFSAGYLANLATLATLCGPDDVILGDARNHASIEDGARLSGARTITVRHDDLDQLATKLGRLDAPVHGRVGLGVLDGGRRGGRRAAHRHRPRRPGRGRCSTRRTRSVSSVPTARAWPRAWTGRPTS